TAGAADARLWPAAGDGRGHRARRGGRRGAGGPRGAAGAGRSADADGARADRSPRTLRPDCRTPALIPLGFRRFYIPRDSRPHPARVFLRPPRNRDWRAWAELRAVSREFLMPWEPSWSVDALSRSAFRRRMRQTAIEWHADEGYGFLIFRQSDHALLGGINLSNVRRGVAQSASLGYWIGAPHARQGYMAEALNSLLPFVFERLGLNRVEAACLPHNAASRAPPPH